MALRGYGWGGIALGAAMLLGVPVAAQARISHVTKSAQHGAHNIAPHAWGRHIPGRPTYGMRLHNARYASYRTGGGLQCVTFARSASGIELSGNAADWWNHAAGLYARGQVPEPGGVLNFRANGRMRLGHVSVVTAVDNPRQIEIDHANWAGPGAVRGGVSRDITVVDVSPNNDWTAVRVGLGHTNSFGSVYPTYGFIYPRPDTGVAPETVLTTAALMPVPAMNPAPRDLRPAKDHSLLASHKAPVEVAEAPDTAQALDGLRTSDANQDAVEKSIATLTGNVGR